MPSDNFLILPEQISFAFLAYHARSLMKLYIYTHEYWEGLGTRGITILFSFTANSNMESIFARRKSMPHVWF